MSDVTIHPGSLRGEVVVPPSKSLSHRAVICAGLAKGASRIDRLLFSDDITATLNGMKALGATVSLTKDSVLIHGAGRVTPQNTRIDCNESGSTLRFLIPAALTGQPVTFVGRGKLVERPLDSYFKIFEEQHIPYQTANGHLPLTVAGTLKPGEFRLKGDVSSQFITGLLFALPLLDGNSKIHLTTELESQSYVDLTLSQLNQSGIQIENQDYQNFIIPGKQAYLSRNYRVEGDYSQAAFWLVAGQLGAAIRCLELRPDSLQGDKVILSLIKTAGGKITTTGNSIIASAASTSGIEINAADCPDIVPILAVLAAVSQGTTHIIQAGRLRLKESDRLRAITQELSKLGAHITEGSDSLTIEGQPELTGGTVDSWQDHRIAMALAIASIKCRNPVTITRSDCVAKSYPNFWQDFRLLGGKLNERHMG